LVPKYRQHSWNEIIGYGNGTSYDPNGDSLYASDLLTDPSHRRQGVGTALIKARKELCTKLGLKRIIGGARLYDYCYYAKKLSPGDYAMRVVAGELVDPVLTFQLRNGFKFVRILPNYIHDRRSLNFAAFIEWTRYF
jgi:GNAT superfamily N-acetyltransferase